MLVVHFTAGKHTLKLYSLLLLTFTTLANLTENLLLSPAADRALGFYRPSPADGSGPKHGQDGPCGGDGGDGGLHSGRPALPHSGLGLSGRGSPRTRELPTRS